MNVMVVNLCVIPAIDWQPEKHGKKVFKLLTCPPNSLALNLFELL